MAAFFTANPATGYIPLTTTLISSNPYSGYATSWNFGDNSASGYGASIAHTYNTILGTFNPVAWFYPPSSNYRRDILIPNRAWTDPAPDGNSGFFDYFKYTYIYGSGHIVGYNTPTANPTNNWDEIPIPLYYSGNYSCEELIYLNQSNLTGSYSWVGMILKANATEEMEMEWGPNSGGFLNIQSGVVGWGLRNVVIGHPEYFWINQARLSSGEYRLTIPESFKKISSRSLNFTGHVGNTINYNGAGICEVWKSKCIYFNKNNNTKFGSIADALTYQTLTDAVSLPVAYTNLGRNEYNKIRIEFSSDKYDKYLKNLNLYYSGVQVLASNFDAGWNSWTHANNNSGIRVLDPIYQDHYVIKVPAGSGNVILERTFTPYDIDYMGPPNTMYMTYDVLYPSSTYLAHDPTWSEDNSVLVSILPPLTGVVTSGIGIRTVYSPLNYVAYNQNIKDYEIGAIDCYRNDVSGNILFRWRIPQSGTYSLLHSGTYPNFPSTGNLRLNLGYSGNPVNAGHGFKHIRLQSDARCPNSGYNPYGTMNSWFEDDFEVTTIMDTGTFGYSIFTDGSGLASGILDINFHEGNVYSPYYSGDFRIDFKMLSSGTAVGGPEIYDSSGNQIRLFYPSTSGHNPSGWFGFYSGVYSGIYWNPPTVPSLPPSSTTNTWWPWWGRFQKVTLPDGGKEISMWWASGESYPGEEGWRPVGTVGNPYWTIINTDYPDSGLTSTKFNNWNISFVPTGGKMYYQEIRMYYGPYIPVYSTSEILVTASPPWGMSGLINGAGWISSSFNWVDSVPLSGTYGNGSIDSVIVYTPHPYVPVSLPPSVKEYYPVLTNQRLNPYMYTSSDRLQSKVEIYSKNKLYHASGIPIELWLNYSGGVFFKMEDAITNRDGTQIIYHPCANIGEIDCCLGYVNVIIDEVTYTSNLVRYNFIEGNQMTISYEIDAHQNLSSGVPIDRSFYDIFNGGLNDPSRTNFIEIDRMFGG